MNYEPMWAVVDAHRRCADELEKTLRELTGDRPAPDKLDLRDAVINALKEAITQLNAMADREGCNVRRTDASRCRVFAGRCTKALYDLNLGELSRDQPTQGYSLHLTDNGPGSRDSIINHIQTVIEQRTDVNFDTSADKLARGIMISVLTRLGAPYSIAVGEAPNW